jgi:ATP-dependent helicase Lhr and Lhr-like helicase
MEVAGPLTVGELAERLGLEAGTVELSLCQLEAQGQVLRGRFRPSDGAVGEWCDRRLLQRIHRLTVGRLRREIEPCSAQDYMRFLLRWHHVDGVEPLRGQGGLRRAVALLQGYEAPAAAWELSLLPARMQGYTPELLERECFAGQLAWGRLTERDVKPKVLGQRRGTAVEPVGAMAALAEAPRAKAPVQGRTASITFCQREELEWLLCAARPGSPLADGVKLPETLTPAARDVALALERRGASFFMDLVASTRRIASEVEDGLWELLAGGLVTADAVDNLRILQSPKRRKRQKATRRGGPGRWSLLTPVEAPTPEELNERRAKLFLQRYGIVWRDVVVREPLSPAWRELLPVFRRLEARGEIRGGRFVSGFAGEQFALPEAVELARQIRRQPHTGKPVRLAAVDPLNLTGVVTPGPRVPAMLGAEVVYVDGVPLDGAPANCLEA